MRIELQWPSDTYSLPQAKRGCPTSDWFSGWRYQDNEDNNNANSWDPNNINNYLTIDLGRNFKTLAITAQQPFPLKVDLSGLRETTALLVMEATVPQAFQVEVSTGTMKMMAIRTTCTIQFLMENTDAIPRSTVIVAGVTEVLTGR